MIRQEAAPSRELKRIRIDADLVVTGGGLAGTCAAIAAARHGSKVVLVQDRPVLGGNASSEVRLWTLGATAHMGNNNRWAREGGILDELLVENMHRNPEGNALFFDTVVLEKVVSEPNITLLLNTAAYEVMKREDDADTIASVTAFCSQNSTVYELHAPLFCDASGDGVTAFLAGAAFRMGAESASEFGEKFCPDKAYGELLGHSIYFYSKNVGRPVRYTPPSYALKDVEGAIPRFRNFNASEYGCRLWWIEYGGRLDTVHDTETIKWELWRVGFGVWNYIKNSGKFPEAENLTLEWIGQIPGKRESRRFEGDYILRQQDVIEGRPQEDAIAFGGWALDLHPADGVFSKFDGCTHWQAKSVYPIPYRSCYSRNVKNLFLAGRIMSVSHVAYGSTRVMATLASCGQAIGTAAALCKRNGNLLPRDISTGNNLRQLQRELLRDGQYVPSISYTDGDDLARRATVYATSRFKLSSLNDDASVEPVSLAKHLQGMLLPVAAGPMPGVTIWVDATEATTATVELSTCSRVNGYTPDVILATKELRVPAGTNVALSLQFSGVVIDQPRYVFVSLHKNDKLSVRRSSQRLTGVLEVHNDYNQDHAHDNIGVDTFRFFRPQRRPNGQNFAMKLETPLDVFHPENVINGLDRPTNQPNAWLADPADVKPTLTLKWEQPVTISRIILAFDADWDHPMESVLMGHPEADMPFCVKRYRVLDDAGNIVHSCEDNHSSRNDIRLPKPLTTKQLHVELLESHGNVPRALFSVRCFT